MSEDEKIQENEIEDVSSQVVEVLNLPEKVPNTWVPEWAHELKSIPGAISAVGKLVQGATKAATSLIETGVAQNEQESQRIRDITKARSALTDASVKIAIKNMGKNPEIAERLLDRLLLDGYAAQEAREDIGLKALSYIRADPPNEPPKSEPSDEWLKRFGTYAEQATSEMMKEHWAHILSHEIKSPGNFSFAALHLASLLDKNLAETVERVAKQVVYCKDSNFGFVPYISGYSNQGERYNDLITLDGVGFLTMSASADVLNYDENGKYVIRIGRRDIELNWFPKTTVTIQSAQITRAGFEILNAIDTTEDENYISLIRAGFEDPFSNEFQFDPLINPNTTEDNSQQEKTPGSEML